MKTNHKLRKVLGRHLKSIFLLFCLMLISMALEGCITGAMMKEAAFDKKAQIKFRVLSAEMPNPKIHWIEYPLPSEGTLSLNPHISGCEKVRFFVNPTESSTHELSEKFEEVEPIQYVIEEFEKNLWHFVSPDNCAVLLTVGQAEDFIALSASTRSGVVERYKIPFQKDIEGRPSILIAAPLFALDEAISLPLASPLILYRTLEVAATTNITDITMIFDFPDGHQKDVKLTYEEAKNIFKNQPNIDEFRWAYIPSKTINFWLHAALLKLKADFRIEAYKWISKTKFNDVVWRAELKSVDKFEGIWCYEIDDSPGGALLSEDENTLLKTGSVIRFHMN